MLQLLQPLWLFTLTGISIPVIIHLWNQQPGKILKVGSISLVTESSKEYKKSLILSDILLLILRCLLIMGLSFALTKPAWHYPANQQGWVLIGEENRPEIYSHFKPLIDSLLKTGLELHYFNEGFQKEDSTTILKSKNDTMAVKPLSYWGLVSTLHETIPHSIPLYLFTDDYLKHFSGTRPIVSPNLQWFVYTPPNDLIQQAPWYEKDSTVLRITLFTGKDAEGARYLKAAIDAIKQFSKKNIQLSITDNTAAIQKKQDWLFWLSDEPLAKELDSKNIFKYQKGMVTNNSSLIKAANNSSFSPVALYKSIVPPTSSHDSSLDLWQDGYGHPVLSMEKRTHGAYYLFYSRFDPAWNELVWNSDYPELIYELLEKESVKKAWRDSLDKRKIDRSQLLPAFTKENEIKSQAASFKILDLTGFCWLLVFLLFFIERLVSFQYYKTEIND